MLINQVVNTYTQYSEYWIQLCQTNHPQYKNNTTKKNHERTRQSKKYFVKILRKLTPPQKQLIFFKQYSLELKFFSLYGIKVEPKVAVNKTNAAISFAPISVASIMDDSMFLLWWSLSAYTSYTINLMITQRLYCRF